MMTPDQIYSVVIGRYPQLVPHRLSKRHGWSFFFKKVLNGPKSTRIFHTFTFRGRASNPTKIKLSVSSRLGPEQQFVFTGDEKALRKYIDQELRLYQKHFANK